MVKAVRDEPQVTLPLWCVIMQDWSLLDPDGPGPVYRVLGTRAPGRGGRVSSPLVSVDVAAQTADTESGRRYVLLGTHDPFLLPPLDAAFTAAGRPLGPCRTATLGEAAAHLAAVPRMGWQ